MRVDGIMVDAMDVGVKNGDGERQESGPSRERYGHPYISDLLTDRFVVDQQAVRAAMTETAQVQQ
jgi:hypothetical protein